MAQDDEERLDALITRLGPHWDRQRLLEIPLDDDLVEQALAELPSRYDSTARLRPTGGWLRFLLPMSGVALIAIAVFLMGLNLLDPTTGTLVTAGGFLLIVLAAMGRGRRVEELKRRRRAEEILLLYGLEPPVTREEFMDHVERLREAKRVLEAQHTGKSG